MVVNNVRPNSNMNGDRDSQRMRGPENAEFLILKVGFGNFPANRFTQPAIGLGALANPLIERCPRFLSSYRNCRRPRLRRRPQRYSPASANSKS